MTVLLDETFATGIPGGFATSIGTGPMTATYNSGAQAVDLVASGAGTYAAWRIDAVAAQASLSVEMDAEVIAFTTTPRFGAVFPAATGLPPFAMFELPYGGYEYIGDALATYQLGAFASILLAGRPGPQSIAGRRFTYRFETYLTSAGRRIASYINDQLAWAALVGSAPTVQAGVYFSNHTSRLHSIKVTDTPTDIESTGFGVNLGSGHGSVLPRKFLDLPQWPGGVPPVVSRRLPISRRPAYHPGATGAPALNHAGFISGTTNLLSGGVNVPYPAKVSLFLNDTGLLVDSVDISVAGQYRFDNLRRDFRYMVVAQDRDSGIRAVIADNIQPDPYP